jgi:hypothetical protein
MAFETISAPLMPLVKALHARQKALYDDKAFMLQFRTNSVRVKKKLNGTIIPAAQKPP